MIQPIYIYFNQWFEGFLSFGIDCFVEEFPGDFRGHFFSGHQPKEGTIFETGEAFKTTSNMCCFFDSQKNWLVVSTHLKNIGQNGKSSPNRGEQKKNIWNHHLEKRSH